MSMSICSRNAVYSIALAGAASMGMAGMATAGTAIVTGGFGTAVGTQALMAACSKANAAESAGGGGAAALMVAAEAAKVRIGETTGEKIAAAITARGPAAAAEVAAFRGRTSPAA